MRRRCTLTPVRFVEANSILALGQDEYEPIAAHRHMDRDGTVTVCFRLSDAEVLDIVSTRTIWAQQKVFGGNFQPLRLTTVRPEDLPDGSHI